MALPPSDRYSVPFGRERPWIAAETVIVDGNGDGNHRCYAGGDCDQSQACFVKARDEGGLAGVSDAERVQSHAEVALPSFTLGEVPQVDQDRRARVPAGWSRAHSC